MNFKTGFTVYLRALAAGADRLTEERTQLHWWQFKEKYDRKVIVQAVDELVAIGKEVWIQARMEEINNGSDKEGFEGYDGGSQSQMGQDGDLS